MITYRLIGKANRRHVRFVPGERVTMIHTTSQPTTLEEYRARCERFKNESIDWIDVESWYIESEVPKE